MHRRAALHILGPFAIVTGSLAITRWAQTDRFEQPSTNRAVAAENFGEAPKDRQAPNAKAEHGTRRSLLGKACERKAAAMAERLGQECAAIARAPFAIAGDLSEEELAQWHDRTIGPASRAMAHAYFDAPPTEPITVLLFRGEDSYNHYAKQLFGEEGISVYGYYKPGQRTLVMNIGTGGGTLVHELTHALVDVDFSEIPDWFNEGLASLHEQCRIRSDETGIDGLENWRLPGLQQAIRRQQLGSLRDLIEGDDFRGPNVGLNYAQARYFCLYMQRQGVLENFYEKFRDHRQTDPQGAATVREVFSDLAWEELDADFRAWALKLKEE